MWTLVFFSIGHSCCFALQWIGFRVIKIATNFEWIDISWRQRMRILNPLSRVYNYPFISDYTMDPEHFCWNRQTSKKKLILIVTYDFLQADKKWTRHRLELRFSAILNIPKFKFLLFKGRKVVHQVNLIMQCNCEFVLHRIRTRKILFSPTFLKALT